MKINVYDFDKTIYDGDSSVDFYIFCLKKNKLLILNILSLGASYLLYIFKLKNKKKLKETFFKFLTKEKNIDERVVEFWNLNSNKIKKFYINKNNHQNDVIISASPEFLLKPICDSLKVKDLIGSSVDKKTGKFLSENCKGMEKVNRLYQKYNNITIKRVYTDSYSDKPLIDICEHAYIVKRNKIKRIK